MGDDLEHKCGVAFIRLLKPYPYYAKKYKNDHILLNLMYLLLLRQRNRGQDAAGIGTCFIPYTDRIDEEYLFKDKKISKDPVEDLYKELMEQCNNGHRIADDRKGNVMIGHTLYPTFLKEADYRFVHPVERRDNWPTKRLMIAMNGNFANNKEQRDFLRGIGQSPTAKADMATLVEKMGYYLDQEHDRHYRMNKNMEEISRDLDFSEVMRRTNEKLRGAYSLVGIVGNGDSFFARDPNGIRPLHYFANDEFIVAASEASAIASTFVQFGITHKDIKEMRPGHMMLVKNHGQWGIKQFADETSDNPCQFEPVYFSRPNNPGVHNSRKRLGKLLAPKVLDVLEKIHYRIDLKKTQNKPLELKEQNASRNLKRIVLSYVPNTSESAALGLYEELLNIQAGDNAGKVLELSKKGELTRKNLKALFWGQVKYDKVLTKDAKLRTFIAQKDIRKHMTVSGYDPVLDAISPDEDLIYIMMEDSIVKGNTLEHNVIYTLAMAGANNIVIVSSEPQIRSICCYGIEMSRLGELLAFRAAIELIKEKDLGDKLCEIEQRAREQQRMIESDVDFKPENLMDEIYSLSTYNEVSQKVSELITPKIEGWNGKVIVIYSSHEMLKDALGRGDNLCMGCLTADYPEIGGKRIINKALIDYFDQSERACYE